MQPEGKLGRSMRCLKCNVDLGEQYTVCPLCASRAIDEPPVLKGLKTSEYPEISGLRPYSKRHLVPHGKTFNHYVFLIAVLLSLLAVCPGIWLFWSASYAFSVAIPSLCIAAEIAMLIKIFTWQAMRVNAVVYLLSLVFINTLLAVAAAVLPQMSALFPCIAIGCGLAEMLLLRAAEPKNFKTEIRSRFHR